MSGDERSLDEEIADLRQLHTDTIVRVAIDGDRMVDAIRVKRPHYFAWLPTIAHKIGLPGFDPKVHTENADPRPLIDLFLAAGYEILIYPRQNFDLDKAIAAARKRRR